MKIEILGTGCPKCRKLTKNAEKALRELGSEADIIKVKKISEIMKYGPVVTPALVISGNVLTTGKVPSVDEIKYLIGRADR